MTAAASGGDETIHDLGQRILSRDLFKVVPVDHRRLSEYLRKPDAYPRLHAAIQPFCRGRAPYYLVVDETNVKMLSDAPDEMAYVIDDDRHAVPIRDHDMFREYWKPQEGLRVFTLAEAV